jgi:hypothetical protein
MNEQLSELGPAEALEALHAYLRTQLSAMVKNMANEKILTIDLPEAGSGIKAPVKVQISIRIGRQTLLERLSSKRS